MSTSIVSATNHRANDGLPCSGFVRLSNIIAPGGATPDQQISLVGGRSNSTLPATGEARPPHHGLALRGHPGAHAKRGCVMAKHRLRKGVRLDLEPIYRESAVKIAHSHTPATRPVTRADSPAPLRLDGLDQPGRLRQVLREIMNRFAQADRTHRDAIDQEVMRCVEIARFLAGDDPNTPRYHSDEWGAFWQRNAPDATKALQFVFKQAHADPKRASFYFRATYRMFEREERTEDYPRLITEGGGYQALADGGTRFPRSKQDTPTTPTTPTTPLAPTIPVISAVQRPKVQGQGRELKISTDESPNGAHDERTSITIEPATLTVEKLILEATFERGGCWFPDLPAGSHVRAHLTIESSAAGKRTIRIWHAERDRKN